MEEAISGVRLRIYLSSTDKHDNELIYQSIVKKAHDMGIAGATVLKGIMGFGQSSVIHSINTWEYTEKLPIVVEIVDTADSINLFMKQLTPYFEQITKGFLITSEVVQIEKINIGKK
ncbi:MAG TPA: DUF190 domain-containing protein [Salinivirgaceae bacterium]|mgnify:CR=1 FL=1|nr:DUF190 domain-containing protein [Salinivirgaceae bacterium]